MSSENRCKCCKGLYSLAAECLIVTLTLVHVLLSTVELMIHLEVIQVPASEKDESMTANTNTVPNTTSPPSQSYDPGGCDISLHPTLDDIVTVVTYTTLVISAFFLIEIACKVYYRKKLFFKDIWQLFDTLIVLLSIGVEIAFFLLHEKLLCYNPATEAAAFVIVFRLWRLPRACNVRKKEYRSKLEDEHRYLRQTKTLADKKCKDLEKLVNDQSSEIEKLKTILRKNKLFVTEENEKIPNGTGPANGEVRVVSTRINHTTATNSKQSDTLYQAKQLHSEKYKSSDNKVGIKTDSDLERNDSDKNSRANDSGIEVKDSFRSDKEVKTVYNKVVDNDDEVFDSDSSELPVSGRVQEVEVQIEEISTQKQLPSVTSYPRSVGDEDDVTVLLRRKSSTTAAAFVNAGYDGDEPDARGTYRSADGIPMTEL